MLSIIIFDIEETIYSSIDISLYILLSLLRKLNFLESAFNGNFDLNIEIIPAPQTLVLYIFKIIVQMSILFKVFFIKFIKTKT